ncbi:MAG: ribosome maturation factor RimP [Bacillati bacterium ANGP1]|uniref:Ribosome maturation factor RimP n=1 Tax=Candidatus Segetimicrobium genomatis TaxID=2569760 RepID=A0A537JD70_9BACT|nr:MAG: ribosome maturation factor RimP [Terrabacteria group bacterium ANGP1]
MRRQEIAEQVATLAGPIALRLGLEVVGVELVGAERRPILRVLIDRGVGAGVEDCARFSEALSRELDLYDLFRDRYTLEVASPGLDRALHRPADFARFSGRAVAITTVEPIDGQRRFRGRLLGLVNGLVDVRLDDGREIRLGHEQIAQARLVVDEAELRQDLKRSRATGKGPADRPGMGTGTPHAPGAGSTATHMRLGVSGE